MPESNNLKHIAIPMDGNRRWATERGLPKLLGHNEGAKALKRTGQAALDRGIPYLTLWALSTENLKRSAEELGHLFTIFNQMAGNLDELLEKDVRFNIIGDLDTGIPSKTTKILREMMERTKNGKAMTLTIAINYGGRDEMTRAVRKMLQEKLNPEAISEDTIMSYLDTHDLPEVDLVIRTGGHQRLSGWLPLQTTYAELYFTNVLWPAFSEADLDKAIAWFHEQVRNRGT